MAERCEPRAAVGNIAFPPLSAILSTTLMILLIATAACNSHTDSRSSSGDSQSSASAGESISRNEAISDHWDDIRQYLNGSENIQACSSESGSCYDLDADIDNGEVSTIHFANGGHLNFSAEIGENGDASDADENGNSWDFTIDMNSSIVDNAVDEWAKANGYDIQ
jgi:hypothetical protein